MEISARKTMLLTTMLILGGIAAGLIVGTVSVQQSTQPHWYTAAAKYPG